MSTIVGLLSCLQPLPNIKTAPTSPATSKAATNAKYFFKIYPLKLKIDLDEFASEKNEMKEGELTEKCWPGYTQKGMKTMFGKRYPNCVKKTKK